MASRIPFISASKIEALLNWDKLLPLLENALVKFSQRSGVSQPARTRVDVAKQQGFLLSMPAFVEGEGDSAGALACKLVTVYHENKTAPTHQAHVILFDHRDGSILATLDGEAITQIRTAAVSAIATKYLAKKPTKTLGILGAGTEARSHLGAFHHVFPSLERIFIWSRRHESCTRLIDEQKSEVKRLMTLCNDVKDAASQSDVICTVTMATEPVLFGAHVRNGTHINAIGAPSANWRELDTELVQRSEVYVDSIESSQKESGDIIINGATIRSELGQLIDNVRRGEYVRHDDAVTVFKSCGLAIEDAVAARYFYDAYNAAGNTA